MLKHSNMVKVGTYDILNQQQKGFYVSALHLKTQLAKNINL